MARAEVPLMPISALTTLREEPPAQTHKYAPINFIYKHFHNSIRAELGLLSDRMRSLEAPGEGIEGTLSDLRERYRFLEQVYKYHSALEDEVLYPALDTKVRNVTLAYSIEHQDEEALFEQLRQLLSAAVVEPESKRKCTIRALICKVEEIHITLRKHLAKEEEQLLPLVLQHFSIADQAELVAQFLYSIPLETVERVLSQLKPRIPRDEQEQLLIEIRGVIPDNLLSQLLTSWLQPAADGALTAPPQRRALSFACCGDPAACRYGPQRRPVVAPAVAPLPSLRCDAAAAPNAIEDEPGRCTAQGGSPSSSSGAAAVVTLNHNALTCGGGGGTELQAGQGEAEPLPPASATGSPERSSGGGGEAAATTATATAAAAAAAAPPPPRSRAPLQDIIHFHRSICSSLSDFAREARSLQLGRDITAGQLSALLERHRFLRSVCVFHSISEEEVLFPEVQRLAAEGVGPAAQHCESDHQNELSSFEDLGRLLADVRAFARRGRKEVGSMLEKLCCSAEAVAASIEHHMAREETDVFPLLEAHLCEAQQRALVYRTIRAMPLRLLERVMPWVVGRLDNAAADALLANIRLGAPGGDHALVELLSRWARRGRRGRSPGGGGGGLESSGGAAAAATAAGVALAQGQGQGQAPVAVVGAGSGLLCGRVPSEVSEGPEGVAGVAGDRDSNGAAASSQGGCLMTTCGPRLLRVSGSGGGAGTGGGACGAYAVTAVDEDGADSKRRRLSNDDSQGAHAGQDQAPPRGCTPPAGGAFAAAAAAAAAAALAAGGGGGYGMGADTADGDAGDMELSTAPRALLRNQSGSLDDRARYGAAAAAAARDAERQASHVAAGTSSGGGSGGPGYGSGGGYNPIDHIFQFHRALRVEIKQMEQDAASLELAILARVRQQQQQQQQQHWHGATAGATPPRRTPTPPVPAEHGGVVGGGGHVDASGVPYSRGAQLPVVQNFHGRFQFLQGIYRAHSKSEDEIVFPALESKQALRNVSHAYTLDHRQEEQLFADLERAIEDLRSVDLLAPGAEAELSKQVMSVRRMCAAIRASLETHVRSEESELWPLFTEHFSREEQQHLVGVIIGRTGAQVLQALLPWVSETFSEEEKEAMMTSLREATRKTMFDQWLDAVQTGTAGGGGGGAGAGGAASGAGVSAGGAADGGGVAASRAGSLEARLDHEEPLQQVAEYLAGSGAAAMDQEVQGSQGGAGGGAVGAAPPGPDSSSFRPGWEDIFRMNQQQLEAAIHRVSNDPTLEPERKAYLMQNIMVSKYIVAQQRRMAPPCGGADGAGGCGCAFAASTPATPASAHAPSHTPGGAAAAACGAAAAAAPAAPTGPAAGGAPIVRTWHNAEAGVLGCPHYQRKCQLVAPCCNKVFTCRLCHDDASDHRMDRYAVSEMRCMLCGERQPVGPACRCCGAGLARYVCNICHLFDDEPGKDIYHCPFCNVCRRGRGLGVDFFHCMNCNACMSLSLFSSHKCREKCIEGNCPVCHEALFDSSQPIKELPCGHFMHSSCFATYTRYNYTCPLCCKSVGDMSVYFQMLDSLLASERLPPEYAGRMQQVLCNDCGKTGGAPFHFVYHSCPHCRSYNTRVL